MIKTTMLALLCASSLQAGLINYTPDLELGPFNPGEQRAWFKLATWEPLGTTFVDGGPVHVSWDFEQDTVKSITIGVLNPDGVGRFALYGVRKVDAQSFDGFITFPQGYTPVHWSLRGAAFRPFTIPELGSTLVFLALGLAMLGSGLILIGSPHDS